MVVWSYSGVRPLYDDGSSEPQQATRDYVLKLDAPPDAPALLSVFGGKITTYRRLAESALACCCRTCRRVRSGRRLDRPRAAARRRLPGGWIRQLMAAAAARFRSCPNRRCGGCCGPMARGSIDARRCDMLSRPGHGLRGRPDRGGTALSGHAEWARTAADVVWRRSKLGLRLSPDQIAAIDDAMAPMVRESLAAA